MAKAATSTAIGMAPKIAAISATDERDGQRDPVRLRTLAGARAA